MYIDIHKYPKSLDDKKHIDKLDNDNKKVKNEKGSTMRTKNRI